MNTTPTAPQDVLIAKAREIIDDIENSHNLTFDEFASVSEPVENIIRDLCTALLLPSDGWNRDMSKAPHDRSVHLGFDHMQDFDVIAHWADGNWSIGTDDNHKQMRLYGRPKPTAWRLCPAPPSPEAGHDV